MLFAEIKSTILLALIFACRMLGLFMVLPVLSLYAGTIPGATPLLIGLAAGVYGLTQACFQLPCGILSDRIGRKQVIAAGIVLFIIGSMLAAYSEGIWGLIVGRAVQGMGAVGAPILALVADLTREQVRTRAMAVIGISIGATFMCAMMLGPLWEAHYGLSGIFHLTALLGLGGLALLYCVDTPLPLALINSKKIEKTNLLQNKQLLPLNISIFILHAVLTASFLVIPIKIEQIIGFTDGAQWRYYLPVLVASLVLVAPLLRLADKPLWQSKLVNTALLGLGIAIVLLVWAQQATLFWAAGILFFLSFNYLEASLPARVSRVVSKTNKGAALGLYSFSQFLGMFAGGLLGGCFNQWMGSWGIGLGCVLLTMIGWLIMAYSARSEKWQEVLIK